MSAKKGTTHQLSGTAMRWEIETTTQADPVKARITLINDWITVINERRKPRGSSK